MLCSAKRLKAGTQELVVVRSRGAEDEISRTERFSKGIASQKFNRSITVITCSRVICTTCPNSHFFVSRRGLMLDSGRKREQVRKVGIFSKVYARVRENLLSFQVNVLDESPQKSARDGRSMLTHMFTLRERVRRKVERSKLNSNHSNLLPQHSRFAFLLLTLASSPSI